MATRKPADGNNTPSDAATSTTPAASTTPTGDTDLVIPSLSAAGPSIVPGALTGAASSGPVVQDGEDESVVSQQQPTIPVATSSQALHQPRIALNSRDVFEPTAPTKTLMLSDIDKRLDELRRTDLELEVVGSIKFAEFADHLKFNEEWLIITVHESTEIGVEDPLPLSINGSTVLIPRGKPTLVRRKYVELLMRMKPQNVTTRIDRSDPDNIKNIIEKRSALRHPFSIIRDDNPRSAEWIKRVMQET